jgi:hypothetical protein
MTDYGPPVGVVGPYASCANGVWRSHPTRDAASLAIQRRVDTVDESLVHVWELRPDGRWAAVGLLRRPYGPRSGRSELPRLDVHVSTGTLVAIDRARGTQSRAAWVRSAVQEALDSSHPFEVCKSCVAKRGGM